ncbi:NPCBM/NEW2 domain-containing protein [Actinophytocola sp. NPDC049390]|uniref:NPCBM/NEW2 domain-containing protein n=1 Tax=Actinophytocola sp. NPDC049390 TaxID=3363894 RepID=UPI0037B4E131
MAGQGNGWIGLGRAADIVGILAFFGITAGTVLALLGGDDTPGTGSSAPSVTTTERTVPTEESTSTTAETPVITPSDVPSARRTLLSELTRVEGSNDIDLDFTDVTIQGDTYENSLHYHCSLYCNGDSPATFEVDLGGKYSMFTAFAGITASGADAPTKIEIDVDGVLAKTYEVRVGQPAEVEVPVAGAQRLRISMYAPAPLPSPIQAGADAAGGVSHVFPDVALGKPTLLP